MAKVPKEPKEKPPEFGPLSTDSIPAKKDLDHIRIRGRQGVLLEVYLPAVKETPESVSVQVNTLSAHWSGQLPIGVITKAIYDAARAYKPL